MKNLNNEFKGLDPLNLMTAIVLVVVLVVAIYIGSRMLFG